MTDEELMKTAIAEAYASCPIDDGIILSTLEFLHPEFDKPARVVCWPVTGNEPEKFRLQLESTAPANPGEWVEYLGVPFEVTIPSQEENAPGQFTIKIANVGHILSESLMAATKQRDPVRMIYREYMQTMPDTPQLIYTDFTIAKASVTENSVEGTATMIDWLLRSTGRKYLPGDFPGLVRGR